MMNPKWIVSAALLALSIPAFAEEATSFDKSKVCEARREQNTTGLEGVRKARPDEAKMRAQLTDLVKLGAGNSICLSDLLGKGDDDIANLLGAIASTDDNIEPAAGPDEGPAGDDFGPGDGEAGGENPGQLNEPVNAPDASPVESPIETPRL